MAYGIPRNPFGAIPRLADYFWRNPEVNEQGDPVPYSGMGGKDLLLALAQSLDLRNEPLMNQFKAVPGQPTVMAYPLGGRYQPRTPGLKAETLHRGDTYIGFDGIPQKHRPPRNRHDEQAYNLRNERDEVIGSANRQRVVEKGAVYVPEMWIDPAYRNTTALFDLYNLVSRGGKHKIKANFANPDLEYIHLRRLKSQGANIDEEKLARLTERRQMIKGRRKNRNKADRAMERERDEWGVGLAEEEFVPYPDRVSVWVPPSERGFSPETQAALRTAREERRRLANAAARRDRNRGEMAPNMDVWRQRHVPAYQPMATRPINVGAPTATKTQAQSLALALEMERRGVRRPPVVDVPPLTTPHAAELARRAKESRHAPLSPRARGILNEFYSQHYNPRRRSGV